MSELINALVSQAGSESEVLELRAEGMSITSIDSITRLPNLRTVIVSDNRIKDIGPLSQLQDIRHLDVSANEISDISPVANLKQLEVFVAAGNLITDISPLLDLPRLSEVDLGGNPLDQASREMYAAQLTAAGTTVHISTEEADEVDDAGPRVPDMAFLSEVVGVGNSVYSRDGQTGAVTRLTDRPDRYGSLSWSPDGTRLVFAGNHQVGVAGRDVYIAAADGSSLTRVSDKTSLFSDSPSWSPDGLEIAFSREEAGRSYVYRIFSMSPDGAGVRQLSHGDGSDSSPTWSPTGTAIAFMRYPSDGGLPGHVLVMDREGNNQRNLTPGEGGGYYPSWSPDGADIAFSRVREDPRGPEGDHQILDIFVVNVETGHTQSLTNSNGVNLFPRWSPDGRQLAFSSLQDGNWDVYLMNADGSRQRNITSSLRDREGGPAWSKDGRFLGYSRYGPSGDAILAFDVVSDTTYVLVAEDQLPRPYGVAWAP